MLITTMKGGGVVEVKSQKLLQVDFKTPLACMFTIVSWLEERTAFFSMGCANINII